MTKQELLGKLSEKSGLPKKDVDSILDALTEVITEDVYNNNQEIAIPALGKFIRQTSEARMGRNPSTGEPVNILAKKKVIFKAASTLKGNA